MTDYREILRLRELGLNHSQIAASMGITRPTVIGVMQRATAATLTYQSAQGMSDRELSGALYPAGNDKSGYKMPDYSVVHREMAKSGVTLQLLWYEYSDVCRGNGEIPYQLTQFKKYYREYALKSKATMHINRKPGELMEVDWAGHTMEIVDTDTGEICTAYIYVAVLVYSGYAYAEAFLSQGQEAWISAHVNAYGYFGGVTRILVPDNLKTGVIKNTRNETVLNRSYREMSEHYGTAIIPTRVKAPKDKATVEGAVGNASTAILAALRNQQFLSLKELNVAMKERLHTLNHKAFTKKPGSRASLFQEERAFLLPLPKDAFEIAIWKPATVAFNYHIEADEHFYSVPYEYLKHAVDVRTTQHVVEVFFEGVRICSHPRLYGNAMRYATLPGHMPPNHQKFLQWNSERFRSWAQKIGEHTLAVIEGILSSQRIEQQGYRACMALLKLSDQYTPTRLEAACKKAFSYTPRPNYKNIHTILKSGQDRITEEPTPPDTASEFGFTRGADYYGRVENPRNDSPRGDE